MAAVPRGFGAGGAIVVPSLAGRVGEGRYGHLDLRASRTNVGEITSVVSCWREAQRSAAALRGLRHGASLRLALNHQTAKLIGSRRVGATQLRLALNHQTAKLCAPHVRRFN